MSAITIPIAITHTCNHGNSIIPIIAAGIWLLFVTWRPQIVIITINTFSGTTTTTGARAAAAYVNIGICILINAL